MVNQRLRVNVIHFDSACVIQFIESVAFNRFAILNYFSIFNNITFLVNLHVFHIYISGSEQDSNVTILHYPLQY